MKELCCRQIFWDSIDTVYLAWEVEIIKKQRKMCLFWKLYLHSVYLVNVTIFIMFSLVIILCGTMANHQYTDWVCFCVNWEYTHTVSIYFLELYIIALISMMECITTSRMIHSYAYYHTGNNIGKDVLYTLYGFLCAYFSLI